MQSTIFGSRRELILTAPHQILSSQVKSNGISKACGMHGGKENKERILVVNHEAMLPTAKPKNRFKNDIKIYLK